MGYRSDVAIEAQKKTFEMLKEAWQKFDFKPEEIHEPHKEYDTYVVTWSWVKWYEGIYKEVDAIMEVLLKANDMDEDEDSGYAYHMIRIGEDDKDVEHTVSEYGWFLPSLSLVREFSIE